MKNLSVLLSLAATFQGALAHYRWTSLVANGTKTADYYFVRQNTNYNSPVTDVTSNDIRCNAGGLASGASTNTATITAGSTVGFALDQSIYHIGPIQVYMSKAPSTASSYDGSGDWFKLAQLGPSFSSGAINWDATQVGQYTFKLPSSTPSGQYLLRVEHIAVHAASGANGAQFYISCANVNVVGGGSGKPGPTIKLPGGYKATDPGILFNPYYPVPTSYTFPGPAVWSG
ncbi:cellulose-growth-specific protein [Delitschia confertaspora ATCC 74209]|uniref:AA9 family lytic polysaccharide monooxygenase n=1 Tax=Delitschia confertaspora ATCC 74209 TaxID=1513339 RepID=A0A9P4JGG2_9PLEO|nr:cellulose-growth-specific protein [Delitschia confertaspora ATCC 74209]